MDVFTSWAHERALTIPVVSCSAKIHGSGVSVASKAYHSRACQTWSPYPHAWVAILLNLGKDLT
eukprot:scaffold188657_cov29-Prasinocladus_malaysianus.AAC.2